MHTNFRGGGYFYVLGAMQESEEKILRKLDDLKFHVRATQTFAPATTTSTTTSAESANVRLKCMLCPTSR